MKKITDEELERSIKIGAYLIDLNKKEGIKTSDNDIFCQNADLELRDRRKNLNTNNRVSDIDLFSKIMHLIKIGEKDSRQYNALVELFELRNLNNKNKKVQISAKDQFREVRDKYPLVWEVIIHECPVECQIEGFHCYPCKLNLQNVSRFDECWDRALKNKE